MEWMHSNVMRREIIITDLTRFAAGNPNVCTAGIDPDDGSCIRPLPYLRNADCARHGLLPGSKLVSEFTPVASRCTPHMEDCNYGRLRVTGSASGAEFRSVLIDSLSPTIEEGFDIRLPGGGKVVPTNHPVDRSIITIQVDPGSLRILEDNWGKLKAHVTDATGQQYSYMPITDLGFFDYAAAARGDATKIQEINDFVHRQDEVLLRIGLSRTYRAPDGREGHWVQLNGVYTFPNVFPGIRAHR